MLATRLFFWLRWFLACLSSLLALGFACLLACCTSLTHTSLFLASPSFLLASCLLLVSHSHVFLSADGRDRKDEPTSRRTDKDLFTLKLLQNNLPNEELLSTLSLLENVNFDGRLLFDLIFHSNSQWKDGEIEGAAAVCWRFLLLLMLPDGIIPGGVG